MDAVCLRVFVQEGQRQAGQPIHDWLFKLAHGCGIAGGIAFRASAGFGRHGRVEDSFFELAGELPQSVEFVASAEAIQQLIERIGAAGLSLVYAKHAVTLGVTGESASFSE
jgi:PII-like signaling protein